METTMLSLATLPRAPPAALYNPLEHGHHLTDNQVRPGLVKINFIARSQAGMIETSSALSTLNLINFNNPHM